MNLARRTIAAVVGTALITVLTGCAGAAEPAYENGAPVAASSSASPSTQTRPEQRKVRALEVIDPLTVKVTPFEKTDTLYGKKFIVHVGDILTPKKGECGYEEALALAEGTLLGNIWILQYDADTNGTTWIDSRGDHYGYLDSNRLPYGQIMSEKGMAVNNSAVKDNRSHLNQQAQAQADGTGLWSTCPGFGK